MVSRKALLAALAGLASLGTALPGPGLAALSTALENAKKSGAIRRASVPSTNGFPMPNDQQKLAIAQEAGGLLPNAPPATSLAAGSTTAFQLIAFNELFETAYFNSLAENITNKVPGYENAPAGALDAIQAVVAQEQQHALGAISTLEAAGAFAPMPCQYKFPVATFDDAINVAETFTVVVLGALQDANVLFTKDGASGPVRLVSSVIGQEGEQNGYYRDLLGRIPSESPFLTTVPGAFAFSALQMFVIPDSCPFPLSNIALPILPGIMTNGGPIALLEPQDQTLSFQTDLSTSEAAKPYVGGDCSGLYLTYNTGQQVPFSVPLENPKWDGSVLSFDAQFPYNEHVMHGFSHGAITTMDSFTDADAVAMNALAAPAIIQVNNPI